MSSPKDRIWSRREIEGQIANGRKIFILDGKVIKADAWAPYHPGGDKAILHMIGRDGTDEVRALHSADTQTYMQRFVIGKIEGRWDNFVPPIQGGQFRTYDPEETEKNESEIADNCDSTTSSTASPSPIFDAVDGVRRRRGDTDTTSLSSASSISLSDAVPVPKQQTLETYTDEQIQADIMKYPSLSPDSQDAIVRKYRLLDQKLRAAGLYQCPYGAYARECCRYLLILGLFIFFLRQGYYAVSGAFLGLWWHQLVFTAHDAGHMGITHGFHTDTCIGIFIADFCGGLSIGWWKRNHNVHHIVTNSPEHDPDIEHMPFFAISHRFFSSLRSTYYDRIMDFDAVAKLAIKYQHWLYYPLLCLGRFNLYRLSWEYLFSSTQAPRKGPAWWHRYLELSGQVFFWYWFGYRTVYLSIPTSWDRFVFVMVSHMITGPLHVQITLSHFAMSTSDLGVHESFPQKMLRTTMDVDCPEWLDFIHGGLQFQAVHHLFPRIPRHNLREAQKYVRAFCEDVGVPYVIYGFARGNREVIGRLEEVAGQLKVLEECRKAAAKDLIQGHNH